MARDDFNRQRLRGIYERNKRRVSALADARDSRRMTMDDDYAPRRYVVSERRTRMEGFGRGGLQVRRVERRSMRDRRPVRFSDRGIFRRSNRDRFIREDDFDRRDRRERFLEDRRNSDRVRDMPRRRFAFSRQRRSQIRELEERRRDGPIGRRRGTRGGQRVQSRRDSDRGDNGRRNNNNNNNRGNNNSNNRGNNNNNNNRGNNDRRNSNNHHRSQSRPRPTRYSHDQLDAQLDNYRRN
eukprot:gene11583-7979_t